VTERLRTFETVQWPAIRRWWKTPGRPAAVAVSAAALFAVAGLISLAGGLTRASATPRAGQPTVTAAAASIAPLLAEAAPADTGKTWNVKTVLQGTGNQETAAFVVGDHWRVDWIFSPAQTGGILQVFIYRADGRLLMNLAVNNEKSGSSSTFWTGPGTYFLKISSSGGDWKVAVQDLH
jgi:hypothetical protein